MDIVQLLSCAINIQDSTEVTRSGHTVSCTRKIYGMLILQIRARFYRSPATTERVSPFFPRLPAFFNRPQLLRQSPPFFLASLPFSLAPNYRENPPFFSSLACFFRPPHLPKESSLFFLARPFFSSAPNYRESPPFFSSLARFFRPPPTTERVPPFFSLLARFFRPPPATERVAPPPPPPFFSSRARLFRLPQLPRARNRLSDNLQRSCLFSTQCLRIEKSVLLEFDRDQYYVLPIKK